MPRLLYSLLLLFLPSIGFSQQWKNFTDTAGKFTAKYPASWTNKIKEGNRVFFTSPPENAADKFYENINISVTYKEAYGTSVKINDLFPTLTEALRKQFTDFKEETRRFFKWNGADAAEVIYSGYNQADESIKVRTTQWYCFYKSRLYLATFVADAGKNNQNETARKIMSSIIFK